MSVEFSIREATLDDVVALQQYAVRLFAERLPGLYERDMPSLDDEREFVRSYSEPERSVMLLAIADGQVIGLLGLLARTLPQEAHVGALGISVDQGFRGQGIGSALIAAALEWAPAHGVTRVEIDAFSNNGRAIRLYERLGFEREGRRRGAVFVDGEPVDVVTMAWLAPHVR